MNFELTSEQQMLRDTVRNFSEKELKPVVEKHAAAKQAIPKETIQGLLKKSIPLGILGNVTPEKDGGAGLDYLTWGLMYEQIERAIAAVIMISSGVTHSISEWGTPEQKKRYLPGLLNADLIGCTGITEPNVGSNPAMIQTRAVRKGDEYVLNGNKIFITNATIADVAIVVASTDPSKGAKGLTRFIVDKSISPFQTRPIETLGGMGTLGELVFEDCRVPAENRLGNEGDGLRVTLKGFQAARCFVALGAIHLAQAAINASIKYAQERSQFGKPIGSFQLIQEMIADMIAETEAARLLAYRGLSLVDMGIRCTTETSIAKFYATEAAVRVTSKAVQIHGAYGLTTEYPVERLFREARMLTIPDGTTQIQKLIVGRDVLGLSAFAS